MYDEFFTKAHELIDKGEPFATATVVRAEKPTSGKPGDKAIVTRSGVMFGWIGGSCAQPTVIEEALAAIAEGEARLVRITPEPGEATPEGVKEVAMTCFSGGTLDVYVEPQQPRPRLLVVGHLPTAQALAHLGKAMSYRVTAVDPETGGDAMAHADEVLTDLDEIAAKVNPLTYVVVASHGHYDEEALVRVLDTPAPYIGLVASRKRAEPILRYLRQKGFDDEQVARIEAPAGLDIGARRGDEIALSIMAEIVQERHRAESVAWPVEGEATAPEAPEIATDPICGMSVRTEGAAHTHEHGGTVYYFCCTGCQARFAAAPEEHLATEHASA
ncbi:MAG: YHS domain-containing protein [bacterium]|nr:YHS domain-containing protein [bacterium]